MVSGVQGICYALNVVESKIEKKSCDLIYGYVCEQFDPRKCSSNGSSRCEEWGGGMVHTCSLCHVVTCQ